MIPIQVSVLDLTSRFKPSCWVTKWWRSDWMSCECWVVVYVDPTEKMGCTLNLDTVCWPRQKAENTETVYVYIFQSDPRSRCLLRCRRSSHRETRWYSDNADVVFSVADVSLSSADSRSTVLSWRYFSFVAALACHQQTRQFSADACAVFSVGGVHRSSTSSRVRTLPCPFLLRANLTVQSLVTVYCSRHHWTQTQHWIGCIERIRIDTCAQCRPAGQGHHRNVCVWTSRLSGAHYRPETATLPEICRLLIAKLWLRSNYMKLKFIYKK